MASRCLMIITLLVQLLWLQAQPALCICNSKTKLLFPAVLVIGDSTVDTGNNNYIITLFKGNHPPYGRDFPGHHPTGRFSNGKIVPDMIATALRIKEAVPPFLDPTLSEEELCTGVSFASGGSGYDDLTTLASGVIPVSKQIEHFKNYIKRLETIAGEAAAKKIIKNALVVMSAGTNDFIFNFYDIPTRRTEFNITGYQDFLLGRICEFVKELYDLGCRKMVVAGLPPIGCLPIQMTAKFEHPKERKCLEDQNWDATSYNRKLAMLLPELQGTLPKSKVIYADVYQPLMEMITHPKDYEFSETKRGCCGTGFIEAGPLCNELTPTCDDPSKYVFWDSVHPSESAYRFLNLFLEEQVVPQLLSLEDDDDQK